MNYGAIVVLSSALSLGIPNRVPAAAVSQEIDATERMSLRALESVDLGLLRAGHAPTSEPLQQGERSELQRLAQDNDVLQQQRAGDLSLSNRELTTVLLVLGIVIALAIIL